MSQAAVSQVTDPGPRREGKSRPQRLNKAGSEGRITSSCRAWPADPTGSRLGGRNLEVSACEIRTCSLKDLDHSPLPQSLSAAGFCRAWSCPDQTRVVSQQAGSAGGRFCDCQENPGTPDLVRCMMLILSLSTLQNVS